MRPHPILGLALTGLVLAACASSEGITANARRTDPAALAAQASLAPGTVAAPWPDKAWWRIFGDPQLDRLMDEALADSPDLRAAAARLRQSQAVAGLAEARRYPRLDAEANSTLQRFTAHGEVPPPIAGTTRTYDVLHLTLGYQLDLWGVDAATWRSALGTARASAVDTQAARLTLTSAVATAYMQLDRQFKQRDISRDLERQKMDLRDLAEKRTRAGLDTEVELRQASAAIASAQADIAAAEEQIALLRQQLAALLGAGPDRGLAVSRPRLAASPAVGLPASIPAELIGRRPDLVAQRWRIEAATQDVAAAEGTFYPNVNLLAFAGFQSIGLDQLLLAGSGVAGAGPAITLPVFDAGRLRSNLAGKNAGLELAVEQYNGTLVSALADVARQVTTWQAAERQLEHERAAIQELDQAYRLALLRYREGLTNYLTVLSAEGELIAQRRREADLQAGRLEAAVGLMRALGGGLDLGSEPAI